MKITRRAAAIGGLSLFGSAALTSVARAEFGHWLEGLGEGLEDFWIASDAYIFGYPLVTMEMTRRVITNVGARQAPGRRWGNSSSCGNILTRLFRDVTAPNADTLYTTAWLDVGKEPWVLSLPDMKGVTSCFRCWTAGPRCSRCPASAPPAPARKPTPLPGRAGPAPCPMA